MKQGLRSPLYGLINPFGRTQGGGGFVPVGILDRFGSVILDRAGSPIQLRLSEAPAPDVLTSFVDELDQDPPSVSFQTSQEGTLYVDYHSSATPPTLGMGDVGGFTDEIVIGEWSGTMDLEAYAGQTFYTHFTLVYDTDQVSNTLTTQEITVPNLGILDRFGAAILDRAGSPINARII